MPAEQAAERAEKGYMARSWENYRVLRSKKLGPVKSALLATKAGFKPELVRYTKPDELAEKFAKKTDEGITRFAGTLKDYFSVHDRDEFANYLMVRKGMGAPEAHYQAWVRGRTSPYYRRHPEAASGFALENWARWKAGQVNDVLFRAEYNREKSSIDAKVDTKEDVEEAIVHGIKTGGVPRLNLNVFWGGQKEGGSGEADEREVKVLTRLKTLANQIGAKGVEVNVNLLFSDVHSTAVNEVDRERIERYHDSMKKLADKFGFGLTRTLPLWKANQPYEGPDREKHLAEAARVFLIGAERGLIGQGARSAEKHAQAVASGEKTPEEMSGIYHAVSSLEKPMFDKLRSPDTLYVTFDDPRNWSNKPRHTIHLWTFGDGKSERPWFEGKQK